MKDLERLKITRKTGSESFKNGEAKLDFDLLDFWRWSVSDVVSNVTRGVLAEYIVAQALDIATGVRDEWAAFDLCTATRIKIEVKSAVFVQSWHQEQLSAITFRTPKTRAWDPDTNRQSLEPRRQADVYVFALLAHQDKPTINPLDVSQWEFYVLPTRVLDERSRSQHSITLATLRRLCQSVPYSALAETVEKSVASKTV